MTLADQIFDLRVQYLFATARRKRKTAFIIWLRLKDLVLRQLKAELA